jgi:acetate kinase
MGFTPLEGLAMGTRAGDMDAAALEYLAQKHNMTFKEAIQYANKQCGVLGISGISSDFRDLEAAAAEGNERAILAIEIFGYRVKKYIGSYAAAMGGVDCVVFTAGIGEHTPAIRKLAVEQLEFMGIELDEEKNNNPAKGIADLHKDGSRVPILLIPTNEELVIAQETVKLFETK